MEAVQDTNSGPEKHRDGSPILSYLRQYIILLTILSSFRCRWLQIPNTVAVWLDQELSNSQSQVG